MIAVAVIGIGAVLFAVQLKQIRPEYSMYLSLGAGIMIFAYAFGQLDVIVQAVNKIQSYVQLDSAYLGTLIKMIGITYTAEFSSNICRDAGYSTVGSQIEMFAKLAVMVLSVPILLALLDTLTEFLS